MLTPASQYLLILFLPKLCPFSYLIMSPHLSSSLPSHCWELPHELLAHEVASFLWAASPAFLLHISWSSAPRCAFQSLCSFCFRVSTVELGQLFTEDSGTHTSDTEAVPVPGWMLKPCCKRVIRLIQLEEQTFFSRIFRNIWLVLAEASVLC